MRPTKNLYTVAERLVPLVHSVEVERVNSGFTISVPHDPDETEPRFASAKWTVAFLADLALAQGVSLETLRETAQYNGAPSWRRVPGWVFHQLDSLSIRPRRKK